MAPIKNPADIGGPGIRILAALAVTLCVFLWLLGFPDGKRRLRIAFGVAAFALLLVSAGCGGGGSGGGGGGGKGGTPVGTTVIAVTATSGTIQRTVDVTLTVTQ